MLQDEDSSDSHENLNIGFSWLASVPENLVSEEVDNCSYDWDNYRENPSFVDPEEDPTLPGKEVELPVQSTPRRQSSTDDQFLDHENPPIE